MRVFCRIAPIALVAATLVSAAPVERRDHVLQERNFVGSTISWLCGIRIISNICQTFEGAFGQTQSQSGVVITLSNGPIAGSTSSKGTRYSVPYAQPPVGALRFKDPKPVVGWSGTYVFRHSFWHHRYRLLPTFSRHVRLDASKVPSPCPQSMQSDLASTNEDCLYMQVFTPPSVTSNSRLPVLVWYAELEKPSQTKN